MLLSPYNERGKVKVFFYALFGGFTLAVVALAMFQTAYGGYESPWWLIAGFFLWLLVMMLAVFGMARLQRRAAAGEKRVVPVGGRYAGAMLLAGTLLLVVGLIGALLDFSIGVCVATSGCGSLAPLTVVAFVTCSLAGVALLALDFGLAARGLRHARQTQ